MSVAALTGALLAASGVAGCASPAPALGTHTAQVTINGQDIGRDHLVTCSQFGWDWKVETLDKTPGFVAMFQTGDTMIAEAVEIQELGGFTGSFWRYTVGDAEVGVTGGTFTLTGTAVGYASHEPDERATATFTIKTDC